MRTRVYEKGWGGRGEHGFKIIEIETSKNDVTIYIINKEYNDWGRCSQVQADFEKCVTIPMKERLTKKALLDCIIEAGKILDETYPLPKSVDELMFQD